MGEFFNELKRRNVIKAAIAYAVGSWILLQVAALVLPIINAPEWVLKTFTFFLALGFPIWLIFSWVYEVTPEGLKKTSDVRQEESISKSTDKRLNILIIAGLLVALTVAILSHSLGKDNNNQLSIDLIDKSIAVLPFDDMSSGGDTEWFCQGVTEDILTNLSKIKELKVISRTSTQGYKNTNKSIPEIAKELGVSYILEGSVRRHENDVIITAQLLDANDNHLWAENYNDQFQEVFRIQQDVSQKIVNQLKIVLSPQQQLDLKKIPTKNMEAYQLVLQGRQIVVNAKTRDELEDGLSKLKTATELDDAYAEAYAELAYAQLMQFFWNNRDVSLLEKSQENIDKALLIDPNTAKAFTTLAIIHDEVENRWDETSKDYEKALKINPNDASTYYEYGIHNKVKPNPDYKSYLRLVKKARELNPLYPAYNMEYVEALSINGKAQEAKDHLNKISRIITERQRLRLGEEIVSDNTDNLIDVIDYYKSQLEFTKDKGYVLRQLGELYDGIMNDDEQSEYYLGLSLKEDSTDSRALRSYQNILVELGRFEEARQFADSKIYRTNNNREQLLLTEFYFNYQKGNYDRADEILKDSVMKNRRFERNILHAQLRDQHYLETTLNDVHTSNTDKAFIYAILGDEEKTFNLLQERDVDAIFINSRPEFDPYRTDNRFKTFLKKQKLPIDLEDNLK